MSTGRIVCPLHGSLCHNPAVAYFAIKRLFCVTCMLSVCPPVPPCPVLFCSLLSHLLCPVMPCLSFISHLSSCPSYLTRHSISNTLTTSRSKSRISVLDPRDSSPITDSAQEGVESLEESGEDRGSVFQNDQEGKIQSTSVIIFAESKVSVCTSYLPLFVEHVSTHRLLLVT